MKINELEILKKVEQGLEDEYSEEAHKILDNSTLIDLIFFYSSSKDLCYWVQSKIENKLLENEPFIKLNILEDLIIKKEKELLNRYNNLENKLEEIEKEFGNHNHLGGKIVLYK